ncbi:MAG: glycosyltransferase family 1 protein [bacterium]
MNITVDTNAVYVTRAGTSRYVRGLLRALRSLETSDLVVSELAWQVNNFEYRQPWRAFKTMYREWFWTRAIAPRLISQQKADILHRCSSLPIRHALSVKEIATIYDLSVIRYPERFRKWHRFSESRRLKALHHADRIICISRFTADEAMNVLGLPANRIEVIYPGTEFNLQTASLAKEHTNLQLPERFYLFVGSLEPGKNLELLRSAWATANSRGIDLPPLVVVGTRWQGVGREGPAPSSWQYVGYQPDEVLCRLYQRALALVFPSKYEGFGLPVLEAMALGCPVICSKVASLPEVGGSAVCYAEMTPQAWLEAMLLLGNDATAREDMRLAGISQARNFTWTDCAAQTVNVYKKALGHAL